MMVRSLAPPGGGGRGQAAAQGVPGKRFRVEPGAVNQLLEQGGDAPDPRAVARLDEVRPALDRPEHRALDNAGGFEQFPFSLGMTLHLVFIRVCGSSSRLLAPVLRVLPTFAAFCRPKLLICFVLFRPRQTLDLRIGVRVPASQPLIDLPSPPTDSCSGTSSLLQSRFNVLPAGARLLREGQPRAIGNLAG
jgi:hypothetical protein